MSSVDERVVKMRFDNAQFERGVQQTLTSLDNLKRKLQFNGVANGLNAIVNTINGARMSKSLNSINSGMDAINKRFSVLGIAGMEVVKRLTNAALNSVTRVATAIPNQIKAGGWARALNLENAQFQLNGLGIAWDKINNDIQYAVNGTAYGLDAAAKVAGQLAASNIEVSDSALTATKSVDDFSAACIGQTSAALKGNGQLDEMATALRSISGVASMSNSSFEEIGQIYTRVAGQGRVMADDLNSIASRGLNAAATLGKYLGKTETEVRDMVSKGQIDFKTFSDAMYDAYADQAVKANNTFQGALSNTKSALSRIGADVADDLLPALTKILNSCRNLFNQVHKWIQPILNSLGKLVSTIGDVVSPIIDKITEKVKSITGVDGGIINQIAAIIDKITEKIKGVLKVFGITGDKTEEVAQKASQATEKVADTVQHIDEMAKKVIHGDFGNGEARINALHAIGENYEKIQNHVNELLGCSFRYQVQEDKTASAIQNTASATQDAAKKAQVLFDLRDKLTKMHMLNGLLNIGKTIKFIFVTIADAVKTTSGKLFKDLKYFNSLNKLSFAKGFDEFTGKLINSQKNMETFKTVVTDIVSGIGNILEAVGKIATAFGKAFIETVSEINALNPTKTSSAFRKLTENLNLSKDGAEGLKDVFKLLLTPLKVIIPVMQTVGLVVLKIVSAFAKLNSKILEFVGKSKLLKSLGKIFTQIKSSISKFFNVLSKTEGFNKFIDSAKRLKEAIGSKLAKAFDSLADKMSKFNGINLKSSWIDNFANMIGKGFGNISKAIDAFTDFVNGKVNPFKVIGEWFKNLAKDISESDIIKSLKKLDIVKEIRKLKDDVIKEIGKIDILDVFSKLRDSIVHKITGIDFHKSFEPLKHNISSALSANIAGGLSEGLKGNATSVNIKNQFYDDPDILSKFVESIKSSINAIDWEGLGKSVRNGLGKFLNTLNDLFKNGTLKEIFNGVLSFIKILLEFKLIKQLINTIASMSSMNGAIGNFFNTLTSTINDLKKIQKTKLRVKAFREIALSVAILSGCVAGLSILANFTNLVPGIAIVSIMVAGLSAIFIAIGKLKLNAANISAFGKASLALSSGITLLTFSLSKVSKMKKYWSSLGRLTVLIAMVAGVLTAMSSLSKYPIKAAPFITLAIAVKLLIGSLTILSIMNWSFYKNGITKLGILLLSLSGAIGLMNRLSGQAGSVKAGTLLAFALDIVAMTISLSVLAHQPMDGIIVAAASLAGIMIALGGAMKLASSNANATKNALAFAVEVVAVGVMLAILANQPLSGVVTSGIMMTLCFMALGGAMKLASSNANATKNALAFAVEAVAVGFAISMVAGMPLSGIVAAGLMMSVAMIALGAAMKIAGSNRASAVQALAFAVLAAAIGLSLSVLASMPIQGIIAAALGISVAAMGLALAGSIGAGASPALLIAAAAVAAFGAALAVAAVGISTAIAVIVNAIGSVLAVIPGMGKVGKSMKEAATGITDFNKSLVDFNTSDAKDPLEGVKNKIESSKDKIKSDLSETKSVVQNGTNSLSEGTEGTGEKLKDNITSGTDEIPDKLASILEGAKSTVTSKVDETGAAAKGSTDNSLNEILASVEGFDLSQGGSDLWSSLGNGISSNNLPFDISNMKMEDIKAMLSGKDLSPEGSHVASTMANGLSANQEAELVAAIKSGNIDKILASGDAAGAGAAKGSLFSEGLASTSGQSDQAGQTLLNASASGADRASETLRGTGRRNGSDYVKSINSKTPNATLAGRNLVNAASNGANANSNSLRSSGSRSGLAYATGVRSQAGSARSGGNSLSSSAVSGASGGYSGMYSAGSYASQGFANGINAYAALAASNASRMVRNAISAARRAADIRSPSRKTYKIGKYFVLGMVNAIADLGYMVSDSASITVSNALDSMRNTLNDIMSGTEDNFDISPRISPVVDLSDAMSGANSLHNMLSGSEAAVIDYGVSVRDQNESLSNQLSEKIRRSMEDLQAKNGTTNLYIDGIKYNTDSYIDGKIDDFVKDIIRKGAMYSG